MFRPCRAPALAAVLAAVAVGATGCQDYNFNPVGHCLLQPGTERFTLSNVSTADVLFVVDESGSMGGEQAELALNFDRFINNLDATNAARADAGLQPIDFHIAVTTSSVFWNPQTTQTCRSDCAGAVGKLVCCTGTTPALGPKRCTSDAGCPGTTTCRMDCNRLNGEFYCCAADGTFPAGSLTDFIPCSREGVACGTMERHYDFRGCSNQMTPNEWPYPQGDFVSWSATPGVTPPNPRVLHFDKKLYGPDAVNEQGFTSAQLVAWFKQNVQVGVCGSGEEQVLQAGRLALQKALAGQQKDTRNADGSVAWSAPLPPSAVNGPSAAARWPNPNSKLVVVFVGDEDDCSSPADPSGGVVMLSEAPGSDACTRDASAAAPLGGKQFPVGEFVTYLANIKRFGRDVAAAFILPAAQVSCTLATCTDAGVCCPPGGCTSTEGAQARGTRLLAAANGLAAAGIEVVAGSICDPDFGALLEDVAEIVKPPQTLSLPTEPAESRITLLRIASANGDTRKLCGQPLAPDDPRGPFADVGQAQATGADWWFTQTKDPGVPVLLSQFVYINPQGACRANPGETYSADYLGVIPAGGCADEIECADKLGGQPSAWECFVPPGLTRGTCTCRGTTP